MTQRVLPTEMFEGWATYHRNLVAAITPLTPAKLALRAAPHLRTIGQMAEHIVAARAYWFHGFLGEGAISFESLRKWDDPGAEAQESEAIVWGLNTTWVMIEAALERWTPNDLKDTFMRPWRGEVHELTRVWVTWHVLEHDLHHGGEVSLTLGMHGLQAPDI